MKSPKSLVRAAIGSAAIFALATSSAWADVKTALEEIDKIRRNLLAANATPVGEPKTGLLEKGHTISFDVPMDKGRTYELIAGGCKDAFDLDLAVTADDGTHYEDSTKDRQANVVFTPTESRIYSVTVKMTSTTPDNKAHYALLIFVRPPADKPAAPAPAK